MQNQINGLTDEKNALNEKLSAAGKFDAQMSPRILRDALKGKSVVLFRTPDAADDDVEAMSRLVGESGGTVTGTITLTQEFVDANSSEKLLSVVNSPIVPAGRQLSTTSVDQGSQAGDLLGIAHAQRQGSRALPPSTTPSATACWSALRDTGFLTYGDRPDRRPRTPRSSSPAVGWPTTQATRVPPSHGSRQAWPRTVRARSSPDATARPPAPAPSP